MIYKELFTQFGILLRELKISESDFKKIVGFNAFSQFLGENRIPALMKLNDINSVQSIFYKTFFLGNSVNYEEIKKLLSDDLIHALVDLNFVSIIGECEKVFVPKINISCFDLVLENEPAGFTPIFVISDLKRMSTSENLEDEYVMSIGGASKSLANMILKEKDFRKYFDCEDICSPSAFDIGCGSGIQALILAKNGYKTFASDISKKALKYAEYNSYLNNVDITFMQGSFFEPLDDLGMCFDLIVSNPPFVITAENVRKKNKFTYRDAQMDNDDLLKFFISNIPKYLKEKGVALFLGNWEEKKIDENTEKWDEKIKLMLSENINAWIVKREEKTPEEYVKLWMDDANNFKNNVKDYEEKYSLWLSDFLERNISKISFGYFILQKNSCKEKRWLKFEYGLNYDYPPKSLNILKTLVAKENISKIKNNTKVCEKNITSIFDYKYIRPKDVTEERYYIPGQSDPHSIFMKQGGSLGRKKQLSTLESAFIGVCDGELDANQICGALAFLLSNQNDQTQNEYQGKSNEQNTIKKDESFISYNEVEKNIKLELQDFIISCLEEGFLEFM